MARTLRIQFNNAIYHITSRGNARQDIYGDDNDRRKELRSIKKHKLDDLSIKIYIPELGIYIPGRSGDLYPGERGSRTSSWYVPNDVEPGEYIVRIVASNDEVRKVKHRYINII